MTAEVKSDLRFEISDLNYIHVFRRSPCLQMHPGGRKNKGILGSSRSPDPIRSTHETDRSESTIYPCARVGEPEFASGRIGEEEEEEPCFEEKHSRGNSHGGGGGDSITRRTSTENGKGAGGE